MFQSSKKRLRVWLDVVDDILVGDPPAEAEAEPPLWDTHPHRRPLRWERARRAGRVPAATVHCLCPVRPPQRPVSERPTMRDSDHALTN
jgi:hypothetical protein